jgi:hypothetical protein
VEEKIIDIDGKVLTKTRNNLGDIEYRNDKGQLHRRGGPATISHDGFLFYRLEGKLHRTDGPSVITPGGYQAYYLYGKLHRTDGYSIFDKYYAPEYAVDGIKYTKEQYPKAVLEYQLKQLVPTDE